VTPSGSAATSSQAGAEARAGESSDCPFCARLAAGERPLIDRQLVAALPEQHAHAVGHAVVITKRHVGRLTDLTADEHEELFDTVRELLFRLEREHDPDGFTVGVNDGPAAGQSTPHVHVHVVPRHVGDVPEPRGGVRKALPPPIDQ
jgi:diadenosine tetraphosphate (Ap4A) HIT family hydrolase